MREKLCIYHAPCADGFAAAWVVKQAIEGVKFHPGSYSDKDLPDVTDKDLILVDFSYKRPVLEEMIKKAGTITILDHHKTAEADLKDLPGVVSVFDMNRAGARITWDFFFPDKTPPPLLLHIEDRDLWRFALPNTREIQAAVFSYEYDFAEWDRLMSLDSEGLEAFVQEGKAIERKHFKDIRELVPITLRRMKIGGHDVPVANLPYTLVSDAANMMSQGELFAACYYDTADFRNFGLRSQPEGLDVAEIAAAYGGGGHKHASGFRVPHGHALAS